MAEEEAAPSIGEGEIQPLADMDVEAAEQQEATEAGDAALKPSENGGGKRTREDVDATEEEDASDAKKQKAERSVEEERLEGMGADDAEGERAKEKDAAPAKLGPKEFVSSVEMFEYFYKLLHTWAPNLDVNKYEFLMLEDLLKKGHPEHIKKIGAGVAAFQVRYHPLWKSRCFFLARTDGSSEDFSFRKCVDHILPLPEDMKASDKNKTPNGRNNSGHGGRGGGGRGGRGGRGRRGRFGR